MKDKISTFLFLTAILNFMFIIYYVIEFGHGIFTLTYVFNFIMNVTSAIVCGEVLVDREV